MDDSKPNLDVSKRFWDKVHKIVDLDACWPWIAANTVRGYGCFWYHGKYVSSHRFAYALANHRQIEELKVIRHKCDNKICCNPKHLEEGSQVDNMRDFYERQFHNWGETSSGAKLTEAQVIEIRKRAATGESHSGMAKDYCVGRRQIDRIANRTSWTRL